MRNQLLNILQVPQTIPQNNEYPPKWKEMALETKEKAHWKCEICGHHHDPKNGFALTVHHKDGVKSNCNPDNLIALCQRCHLKAQALLRKLLREKEKQRLGQKTFFDPTPGVPNLIGQQAERRQLK